MNTKLIVFAALVAVAFADTFTPAAYPCKYHLKYPAEEDGYVVMGDEYGMLNDKGYFIYEKFVIKNDTSKVYQETIITSDVKKDGKYLRLERKLGADGQYKCSQEPADRLPNEKFDYTKSEDVDCPKLEATNADEKCKKLINDKGEYIIVDNENRYRWDGAYYYHWQTDANTVVKPSMFVNTFCTDLYNLTAPAELCGASTITLTIFGIFFGLLALLL